MRVVGGVVWLASAISVSSRLWLGGVLQIRRDRGLIRVLLERVRTCGAFDTLLLCTDGLSSYPKQALKVFSEPIFAPASEGVPSAPFAGRSHGSPSDQTLRSTTGKTGVVRRIVRGTEEAVRVRLNSLRRAMKAR